MLLGPSDRSEATQAMYQHDLDNGLLVGLENEPAIVDHGLWKLIVNKYPYDAKWCTSMMLVLNRQTSWDNLNENEIVNLHELTNLYLIPFDRVSRNGASLSSAPKYPHVHLLQGLKS